MITMSEQDRRSIHTKYLVPILEEMKRPSPIEKLLRIEKDTSGIDRLILALRREE